MTDESKSKLWVFLNSNFGLFMMSSIVVSFITWSYTQWTDSLEEKRSLSVKSTMLETEISYRTQLMRNYFESECSEHSYLSRKTFDDIEEIYIAAPKYQAIFVENLDKPLHILIWEMSSVQNKNTKPLYISCFDSLLLFNSYLNRLRNQVDLQGQFYGENVAYEKEVAILKSKFTSALGLVYSDLAEEVSDESEKDTKEQVDGDEKPIQPASLQFSVQELLNTSNEHAPSPERDIDKPFLMPVEDVFSIAGRETVATGRIVSGKIHVGNEVELVGLGAQLKTVVTGIEMFRKLLDEGVVGDNVGLSLRNVEKEEIKRGMVLATPGSITPHKEFEAEIYFLTKEEGGRNTPFFSGYRPQFYFRTVDVTGSIQLPEDVEKVMPGDHVALNIKLSLEVALEEGLRFAVREGGRTVGTGIVTSVIANE